MAGCESGQAAKLQEAERNFDVTVQSQLAYAQWQLDESTAKRIFWRHYSDAPPEPTRDYEVFIKCHESPPTHEANKKTCAALEALVVKREAMVSARAAKDKVAW